MKKGPGWKEKPDPILDEHYVNEGYFTSWS